MGRFFIIIRRMTRLFVKRLTVIDFSYLHTERGLLGESWQVDVELSGKLDDKGMVLDFSDVKKTIKHLIDKEFDHKLIIPTLFPGSQTQQLDQQLKNTFTTNRGETFEHTAPESAYCFVETAQITEDSLKLAIEKRLQDLLPENVETIKLTIYPELIEGAYYHYSHGLKLHEGNCQRIAHGHRSRIEIFENGQRSTKLENEWAEKWRDIYIGSRADLIGQQDGNFHFSYQACQGSFDLILPTCRCYLIDTDSTVENLARHILQEITNEQPDKSIEVHAFEGVDKGSIESTVL